MAASVAEILLRVTGDSSSARRELELVARQVQQLDSTEGSATADVDTVEGERKLKDLFGQVARWARERASAKIDADTSDAVVGIDRVSAKADVLDAKHVDVEVSADTDRANRGLRGFLLKLGGMVRVAGKAQSALGDLAQAGMAQVAGRSEEASKAMESFTGTVGTSGIAAKVAGAAAGVLTAAIAPILVAAIISAVSAIGALVASLTLAAGALGVLAVGFGALLAPAILTVAAAVERFKRTAGIAGTAAAQLKNELGDFLAIFRKAVAPGVGAIFGGLVGALRVLEPVVTRLGPVFERLGRSVGVALVRVAQEFARPVWVEFFRRLIGSAQQVLPPLTRLFIAFLRVLRNVTLAVLPFLAPLLDAAAKGMRSLARNGLSAQSVLGFFADALPHLQLWLSLLKAIGSTLLGFVKAAAPAGKELVQWLTEGAQSLAEWVNSAKGQEEIRKFFQDTLPLVKQTVEFFARLTVVALSFARAVAPALTGVMQVWNFWLGLIQKVLTAFNSLSASTRSMVFPLNGLTGAFSNLSTAFGSVIPQVRNFGASIVGGLSGAVSGAAKVVKGLVSTVVSGIKAGVGRATAAAAAVAQGVRDGIASVAGSIRDTVRGIVQRVIEIVRSFVGAGRAAGTAVFTAIRNGIASVAGAIHSAARSILSAVIQIVRGFTGNARSAGTAVFNAVRNGIASVAGAIRSAAHSILQAVMSIVRSYADNARSAGTAVFNAVRGGIASVAGAIRSAATSAIKGGLSAVLALAGSFFNAGRALVSALANGITSAAGDALGRLGNLAGKLRSLLPGSEPKDPTSPLRGLADAGAAIVANIAAGIARAGPLALGQLSGQLAATVIAPAGIPAPAGGLGDLTSAIRSMPSGSTVGPTVNLHLSSLVPADSASLAAIADVVTDALSRQGYRGAKVQVVG